MPTYHITVEQQQQILNQGYTRLDAALPVELLSRWRNIAEQLEAQAMEKHHAGEFLHGACVVDDPVGPRLMRYDDILQVDPEAVLDLLACPAMMASGGKILRLAGFAPAGDHRVVVPGQGS